MRLAPLLASIAWLPCLQMADAAELQAGAAKIEITPPVGFPLWGYAKRHDQPSVGVLDPLYARALVLASGKERLAIVSLDLGRAPTRRSTAAIRTRARNEAGIQHLFLVATHTHHGPVVELDNWPTRGQSYVRDLEQNIVRILVEAARSLRPARLRLARADVPLNHNRHSKRADKPLDRELLVLQVEEPSGKPIATAVNFAAHATLTDPRVLQISADYPGVLERSLEHAFAVPCLFLQAAAGDLSPETGSFKGPRAYGEALAHQAQTLLRSAPKLEWKDDTLRACEDDFRFTSRVPFDNPVVHALFARAFFPDLVDFYVDEYHDGIRPHLTTALLGGQVGLVGVSGEFFCAHALALKRRARLPALLFLGYCNDYQQYFPTIEAAAEGGYGADPQMAPAEVGAGEQVMDRALIRLYQLQGRLKNPQPGH